LATQQVLTGRPLTLADKAAAVPPALWLAAFTPVVLLIHGYHPFADDAGIYVSGIRKLVDPSLYRPDAVFVLANTRYSVFAHLLAALVRVTRIPLDYLLFITHLATIFAFLLGCWSLARRIFASPAAQWSAVALTGVSFTMPAVATALLVMDPYVTARSCSTPLSLFALAAAIDHRWLRSAMLLLLAALMHPLMAAYAAAFIVLFILVDLGHWRLAVGVSALGILATGAIYLATRHLPVSGAYNEAIHSPEHGYLFPSEWTWYQDVGLIIPLAAYISAAYRLGSRALAGKLSMVCVLFGTSAALSAFLFVHNSGPYLLVRLQLLRTFHILYLLATLLFGGFLGKLLLDHPSKLHHRRRLLAAFALLAVVGLVMFHTQRLAYPRSAHIELPGEAPSNPWQQAFLWIKLNTPADAVFAANPTLVSIDGEDTQGFRATTARSMLGDDKDAGVVIVFPWLAAPWAVERDAQANLDQLSDADRLARLRPLGVTWLLLSSSAVTSFACPYRNGVAQVCHLGE
jgi:hypothetical protein